MTKLQHLLIRVCVWAGPWLQARVLWPSFILASASAPGVKGFGVYSQVIASIYAGGILKLDPEVRPPLGLKVIFEAMAPQG